MAEEGGRTSAKSLKDVPADAFIEAFAAHLKKSGKVTLPANVDLIKTGTFKELAPLDADWFYIRTAAIARRVYINQGLGVGAFRKIFGGRSNKKGKVTPEHFARASAGHIRHALQQLEAAGWVEKYPGSKGGRRITPAGQRELDLVAGRVEVQRFHIL